MTVIYSVPGIKLEHFIVPFKKNNYNSIEKILHILLQ